MTAYRWRGIPGWDPAAAFTPKPRPVRPSADPAHGTVAGYQRHRRRKETVCEPCRHARNAYKRDWKAKRKAS